MRKNNLLRATGGLSVIALGAFLLVPPAIAQDDGRVSIGFAKSVTVRTPLSLTIAPLARKRADGAARRFA